MQPWRQVEFARFSNKRQRIWLTNRNNHSRDYQPAPTTDQAKQQQDQHKGVSQRAELVVKGRYLQIQLPFKKTTSFTVYLPRETTIIYQNVTRLITNTNSWETRNNQSNINPSESRQTTAPFSKLLLLLIKTGSHQYQPNVRKMLIIVTTIRGGTERTGPQNNEI